MISVSDKGKNFQGELLTEDNLLYSTPVIYRRQHFTTGNRRGDLVELFIDKMFIRVAKMKNIRLFS